MSVRGPRGGRGRGRARGGGRGAKTVVWEWESYTPGPEVYEQLWRVRKEPAIVTPHLPHGCPIPNAHSLILDRRQTESKIQRNFYVVRVTYSPSQQLLASSSHGDSSTRTEVVQVDLSRILEYVSPQALEDFEHQQFRIEAAAEAEVLRQEAEELARKRLEKNFRVQGTGKGSRLLKGLGLGSDAPPRGRGRGRGKRKGRGNGQGRSTTGEVMQLEEVRRERLEHVGPIHVSHLVEEDTPVIVTETESEDESEQDKPTQTSPNATRSAFVANSALSVSPVVPHRRLSTLSLAYQATPGMPHHGDSDVEMGGSDVTSRSSATTDMSDEGSVAENRHRNKRRRTESTTSNLHARSTRMKSPSCPSPPHPQPATTLNHSSIPISGNVDFDDSSDESIPAAPRSIPHPSSHDGDRDDDTIRIRVSNGSNNKSGKDDGEAEVFVVETVIKHAFKDGKKHYLVKWEDYDESYDWLLEEELEGAPERVAEYEESIARKVK